MIDNKSEGVNSPYPIPTAAAMILNPAGELLLLKSLKWNGLFGFPGGKIDYGERIEDALVREIKEETGLVVYDLKFFIVQELISEVEFVHETHFISVNYVCRSHSSEIILNEEAKDYVWCSPIEALALSINRPTRVMIKQYLQLSGKEDIVAISDLRVNCIVGVHDWERKREQPVLITVELYVPIGLAATGDDLNQTVNYSTIAQSIQKKVKTGQYQLLETMAEELAKMILAEHSSVRGVRVVIKKPRAISDAQWARVDITRYQHTEIL
jgi:FolB domain-containing protein